MSVLRIDVHEQIGTSTFDRRYGAATRAAQPHYGAAAPLELNVGSVAAGPALNRFSWPILGWLAKATEYPSSA